MKTQERNETRAEQASRLTQRDLEILQWLSRVRFATVEQVAERFSLHVSKAYQRLRALSQRGLVRRTNLLQNQPGVHHATRAGLRLAGYAELPVATVSLQSFVHEQAVVWVQARLEADGGEVLTEREMRAQERQGVANYLVHVPASVSVGSATHRPDLAVIAADRSLHAIEVELVQKSEARLTSILTAYADSPDYASVAYLVADERLVERVQRVAEALAMGRRCQVRPLERRDAAA